MHASATDVPELSSATEAAVIFSACSVRAANIWMLLFY